MSYLLKTFQVILLLLSSIVFYTGCEAPEKPAMSSAEPLSRTDFVLGTAVTLSLYDHQSDEILDRAFAKLASLEDTLSINKPGTLIDEVNAMAGIAPVKVDEATYRLIETGLAYSRMTDGAFDITIGPLTKLWNIGFPDARVPSQEEITEKLSLINYKWVQLDQSAQTVYLEKPGMLLDLGGIGKGYATDEIASLLHEAGVEHAIINLGGNIYALGNKAENTPWTIGIQDPFHPRGNTIATLKAADKSIVTSGIYERYVEDAAGNKYHHLLNPKTGYPYTNELAGVTIIGDTSTDGDALSTAAFALGVQEGLKLIEGMAGIDAVFITVDYKVYATSGIKESFKLTDSSFTLIEIP